MLFSAWGLFSSPVFAITSPPIPLEPIYFEPPVVEATEEFYQYSCVQLDKSIRNLYPYKYSYKPGFYEDDFNRIAVVSITSDIVPVLKGLLGVFYLTYSNLVEEKERRRVLGVDKKIEMLQQVKAEKHCFE
ncbi:MAG: hypothetical protein COA90_04755 [Gammaproteobacteria bacterium]|nr:MAG: hypothetical protein COA90_04755 [Gammaproteobacteria bacterium]